MKVFLKKEYKIGDGLVKNKEGLANRETNPGEKMGFGAAEDSGYNNIRSLQRRGNALWPQGRAGYFLRRPKTGSRE
jgi:hypothetical protein